MSIKFTATKSFAVLAFAAAAVASQALSFTTEQIGNFTSSTSGTATTVVAPFNVFATSSNPAGVNFFNGILTYTEATPTTTTGTAFTGTFRIQGATASDYLTFALAGTAYTGANNSESLSATAVLTGSGGGFAQYLTGAGNLSTQVSTLTHTGDNRSGTTFGAFSADVQAVPEPVSMAVLGFGVVGLIARRRKA